MRTVMIGVASRDLAPAQVCSASRGEWQEADITFESPEHLFKTLTHKRWQIVAELTGVGVMSVDELALRVGRSVRAVRRDLGALVAVGVLMERGSSVFFPYDEIRFGFAWQGRAVLGKSPPRELSLLEALARDGDDDFDFQPPRLDDGPLKPNMD